LEPEGQRIEHLFARGSLDDAAAPRGLGSDMPRQGRDDLDTLLGEIVKHGPGQRPARVDQNGTMSTLAAPIGARVKGLPIPVDVSMMTNRPAAARAWQRPRVLRPPRKAPFAPSRAPSRSLPRSAWRLSNTLTTDFCVEGLEEAIARYGIPEIFNTDQGSQFTDKDFTDVLKEHGIDISMDGRGRWRDNVFIERFWRSIKYEEIYLRAYADGREAKDGIGAYITLYNGSRPHSSLEGKTPDSAYFQQLPELRAA